MNEKPTILVLAFTDLSRDARIRRQLRALSQKYHVMAVGNKNPEMTGVSFIQSGYHEKTPVERVRMYSGFLVGRFKTAYWYPAWLKTLKKELVGKKYDLILANDVDTLPLACALQSIHGILFDSHEFAPREFDNSFFWRLLFGRLRKYQCKTYLPKTAARTTVAPGIAKEYEAQYGCSFSVITNAAPYHKHLVPTLTDEKQIHLVHHGVAIPSRGLEVMIETMKRTDSRFHLHFYLMGSSLYIQRLQKKAKKMSQIHFHPPVESDELTNEINQYDIGFYLIKTANFNEEHSLPNKFFEFVQGRLAVSIGPSVEMAPFVKKFDLGIVTGSFKPNDMAQHLNQLTKSDIDRYKACSAKAAKDLSAEKNDEKLLEIVGLLMLK